MIDREKAIKGLKCHAVPGGNCLECPYGKYGVDSEGLECENKLASDALELLKAYEPRVMTLEEIDDDDAYWFEEKYGKKSLGRNVLIHSIEEDAREPYITFVYTYGEASYKISEYGQTWRLWTSKPTDEQREAAPWLS